MELIASTQATIVATISTLTLIAVVAMFADRVGNLLWYAFSRFRWRR